MYSLITRKKSYRATILAFAMVFVFFLSLVIVPHRANAGIKQSVEAYLTETVMPDMTTGLIDSASNILLDNYLNIPESDQSKHNRFHNITNSDIEDWREEVSKLNDEIAALEQARNAIAPDLSAPLSTEALEKVEDLESQISLKNQRIANYESDISYAEQYATGLTNRNVLKALIGPGSPGRAVMAALQAIGIGLVVLYFMINLISSTLRGEYTLDMWFKTLTTAVIAMICILMLPTIIDGINKLGTGLAGIINQALVGKDRVDASEIVKYIMDGKKGTWDFILLFITSFVAWLFVKISLIAIRIASYALLMEFMVRMALMPLAIANIAQDGIRGSGMRYLKKYLALYIRIGVILLICAAASAITINAIANGVTTVGIIFAIAAINFAAIAMIFRTAEIANDVVGV